MVELLKEQPLKSITPDRGKEFSKHPKISNELNLVEFILRFHITLGREEQMKIQMVYLENIFLKQKILIKQMSILN